jgi:hypothetical protein
MSGERYIAELAHFIRNHSAQLSASSAALKGKHDGHAAGWASMLYLSGQAPTPLTLTIDLYHLYYVLLKIQEAGFADVGDMDEPLRFDQHRRPALPAARLSAHNDRSDTISVKTGFSTLSKGISSIGSSWWGASSSATANADPATALEKNLKLIYTAFTLLPSLKLVLQDTKGKSKAIEGFDFPDLPGDRMLPLKSFKSLERLELEGIDARVILFTGEWDNIVNLRVKDCGVESLDELLSACKKGKEPDLAWGSRLQILDFEHNDITSIDTEDTEDLNKILSLNLRKNLLVSVPSGVFSLPCARIGFANSVTTPPALANLTSLRALDLSDNMIDSVLAIYKCLPGLSM